MSLLQSYGITCDQKGNFILDFTCIQPVDVSYSTDIDGTNIIHVSVNQKGATTFSKVYGSTTNFKFAFDQGNFLARDGRKPSGDITGG